jgi:hypothetical protein
MACESLTDEPVSDKQKRVTQIPIFGHIFLFFPSEVAKSFSYKRYTAVMRVEQKLDAVGERLVVAARRSSRT